MLRPSARQSLAASARRYFASSRIVRTGEASATRGTSGTAATAASPAASTSTHTHTGAGERKSGTSRRLKQLLAAGVSLAIALPSIKVYLALQPLAGDPEKDPGKASTPAPTPARDDPLPVRWYWWLFEEATDRLIRDVYVAGTIVADYVKHREEADWRPIHQRCADRLLKLCQVNRGVYIKLGQHVAQLEYMLPEEYTRTMRVMLNAAPVDSFEQVRGVIEKELGRPVEDIFDRFDPKPIASASLAQVHIAYLKGSGRKVAVKVQHAGLRETSTADIATVAFLVRVVKALFPRFDYQWLADEIQDNLPRELNFLQEASNCEEASRRFAHRPEVVAPSVFRDFTTPRVLTMSFEEGVYVNDVKAIRAMGLSPTDVARLVSEAFSEQIFLHGWCHCDPHAANLLIRRHKGTKKPELVLLDHGLYRSIPHDLRINYSKLWRSIIFADEPGIKKYAERMNAGDMYQLWASILTTRSWDTILAAPDDLNRLQTKGTAEEKAENMKNARDFADEIGVILRKIPRELLLILKTNDCLRSVDFALGSPVNNMVITARYTQEALSRERQQRRPGWFSSLRSWVEYVHLETNLTLFSLLVAYAQFRQWWAGSPKRDAQVSPTVAK